MRSGLRSIAGPFEHEQIGSRTLHVSGADRGLSDVAGVITDSETGRNRPAWESGSHEQGEAPARDARGPGLLSSVQTPRIRPMSAVTSSIDFIPSTVFNSPVEA